MALDQPDPGYASRSPKTLQALADGMGRRAGVPFILLSRPGIFGSSGEHKQRRRELEPHVMPAALAATKARHRLRGARIGGIVAPAALAGLWPQQGPDRPCRLV